MAFLSTETAWENSDCCSAVCANFKWTDWQPCSSFDCCSMGCPFFDPTQHLWWIGALAEHLKNRFSPSGKDTSFPPCGVNWSVKCRYISVYNSQMAYYSQSFVLSPHVHIWWFPTIKSIKWSYEENSISLPYFTMISPFLSLHLAIFVRTLQAIGSRRSIDPMLRLMISVNCNINIWKRSNEYLGISEILFPDTSKCTRYTVLLYEYQPL